MSWGLLHWGMLAGLAGVSIPVLIHWLNRRRTSTVDWGAMQFLELGRRARIRFRLSELILLAARMALMAVVALALARPFWIANQPEARGASAEGGSPGVGRRDVVLVIDGSGSMARKAGPASLMEGAIAWARQFLARLGPGDSVAVLIARPGHAAGRAGQLRLDEGRGRAGRVSAGKGNERPADGAGRGTAAARAAGQSDP